MKRIIAIDKDGNTIGAEKTVSDSNWEALLRFGKILRWKEMPPIKGLVGRDDDDDKPNMKEVSPKKKTKAKKKITTPKDYKELREVGIAQFDLENWDKALSFLGAAYKLRRCKTVADKIAKCKKNIGLDKT